MADAAGLGNTDMVKNEPVKSRQVNPTQRPIFDLQNKHPLVTLVVGDLGHNIQRASATVLLRLLQPRLQNLSVSNGYWGVEL